MTKDNQEMLKNLECLKILKPSFQDKQWRKAAKKWKDDEKVRRCG